ncbi:MAG: peptidoglycan-binding domain-containing protein [Bryobacteraceae bacterium]|jgi:peptidoglycan hydrolase-like protein with peptidoglycan-binding domain
MDRTLSQGISGPDVRTAQAYLNLHTASPGVGQLKQDGVFGPVTKARTIEFQRRASLKADGVIGPKTRAALLSFQRTTVQGTVTPRVILPPTPNLQLPPSLGKLPDIHDKPATPYLQVPDGFWPKSRDTGWQIKKWEFQGGNEFDLPWSDSSPAQISVEATLLRRLNGKEQEGTLGAQWSSTPSSADGRWNAQFYFKKSFDDLIPNIGPLSLLSPWVMAYVKIPSSSSAVAGFGIGNESSVDLIKNADKKTVLSFVFGPALTLDLIDLDGPKLIGKPNGQFTSGLKVTIEPGPVWKGAPPGHTAP